MGKIHRVPGCRLHRPVAPPMLGASTETWLPVAPPKASTETGTLAVDGAAGKPPEGAPPRAGPAGAPPPPPPRGGPRTRPPPGGAGPTGGARPPAPGGRRGE